MIFRRLGSNDDGDDDGGDDDGDGGDDGGGEEEGESMSMVEWQIGIGDITRPQRR